MYRRCCRARSRTASILSAEPERRPYCIWTAYQANRDALELVEGPLFISWPVDIEPSDLREGMTLGAPVAGRRRPAQRVQPAGPRPALRARLTRWSPRRPPRASLATIGPAISERSGRNAVEYSGLVCQTILSAFDGF
jgi:hypothetical protein